MSQEMSIYDKKRRDLRISIPYDFAEEAVANSTLPASSLEELQLELNKESWERSDLEKWADVVNGPWEYCEVGGVLDSKGGSDRNFNAAQMKLAAAAPELLESLIRMYAYLQTVKKGYGYTLVHADLAITKALPESVAKKVLE